MKKILLSSKNKELKEYTLVSDIDYEHLKQFKWHKNQSGYIATIINNNSYILHRYIMIEILSNKNLTRKNFIDHINNNRIDNTRENLRIVTASENSRNKVKRENVSSKYYGVSLSYKKWKVKISYLNLLASYDIEEHAAYQWDLWIDKFNITHSNKNNIIKPTDFIEYIKKNKLNNLPKHIFKNGKKYIFRIKLNNKNYISSVFDTIDKAVKHRDEYLKKQNDINNKIIIPKIIIRNENNDCIIEIFKNKKRIGETIVDKENYNDLIKYKWCLNTNNYISGSINGKKTLLHRYIMNYTGENYIDHINNNSLDNRKCNLRIVTPKQNALNKKSVKNSSSKYIGVHFNKTIKKWCSSIKHDNKKIYLGSFDDEKEAAKARDIATLKYYGGYGNVNFPIS